MLLSKPIDSGMARGTRSHCGRAGEGMHAFAAGGFSLVELLAVMAIISLMMAVSGVLFRAAGSRSSEPASRMARGIELARAQAVASNISVAIRFLHGDSGELVMRFLRKRPGQSADQVKEFRRPERFPEIRISSDLSCPRTAANPQESHALATTESLVITADGQVMLGTGIDGFPVAAEQLLPAIHLGVQPTRAGQVVAADRYDVAIVQIQCATGSARVLPP